MSLRGKIKYINNNYDESNKNIIHILNSVTQIKDYIVKLNQQKKDLEGKIQKLKNNVSYNNNNIQFKEEQLENIQQCPDCPEQDEINYMRNQTIELKKKIQILEEEKKRAQFSQGPQSSQGNGNNLKMNELNEKIKNL